MRKGRAGCAAAGPAWDPPGPARHRASLRPGAPAGGGSGPAGAVGVFLTSGHSWWIASRMSMRAARRAGNTAAAIPTTTATAKSTTSWTKGTEKTKPSSA